MAKIYDIKAIGYMNLFSRITRVSAKDCFSVGELIIFIAPEGNIGKVVGKAGKNVKFLRDSMRKQVQIIEYADNPISLTKNFVFPLKPKEVTEATNEENGLKELHIEFSSPRERRSLLDNQQKGLKTLKEVINRYFKDISKIRVL